MSERPLTPVQQHLIEVLRAHGAFLINSRASGVRFSNKAAYMAWRGLPVQWKTVAALVAAGALAPKKVNAFRQEFRLVEGDDDRVERCDCAVGGGVPGGGDLFADGCGGAAGGTGGAADRAECVDGTAGGAAALASQAQ